FPTRRSSDLGWPWRWSSWTSSPPTDRTWRGCRWRCGSCVPWWHSRDGNGRVPVRRARADMTIDRHTHSAVSDGTDSPEELVRAAARAGLSVVALTDHDTGDGLAAASRTAEAVGIGLLPGVEVSTRFQ